MTAVDDKDQTKSEKQAQEETVLLKWTTQPMKDRPIAAVLVSIFILICAMLVFYATMSRMFGGLAALVLVLSLSKFYFPTVFTLTDHSVSVKTTTQTIRKGWEQYRSFYPDKNGVQLSPFAEPSRLENFRGIYLIFGNNREEVIRIVEQQIKAHASTVRGSSGNPS
ncbi:MAG TPA: hypothetical protein VJ983_06070 [candidate division Zixibacteria bacterium]|nr:hypothetical protein [candidate division Zixibacteria bacterium]